MLVSTALVAVVALRFRLFDRDPSRITILYALAVAVTAVVAYVVVFRAFAARQALLAFAVASITAVVAVVLRHAIATFAGQRVQMERMSVLGRLSAQMAHDLKNPLTAIRGAAQFLTEERARGRSIDEQKEFLELFVRESDRLVRLVDRYQRLGRLDPELAPTDVNALVRRIAGLARFGTDEVRSLETELDPALPQCRIDADLVATAVENLVSNAFEASKDGGRVVVRTARVSDPDFVVLRVEDEGVGMDARCLERATDELFTTKARGSGLGLPFAKRVAEAHGGRIELRSQPQRGTQVELWLRVDAREA
jgi:signal transduction histidine kinase